MANLKISQLTDGNPAQSSDQIPINRGGTNFRITAGSIASSLALSSATVAVTAAQLKNLTAAPKQLVAGVSGHFYVPISAIVEYVFVTPAYSDPNVTSFVFQLGNESGTPVQAFFSAAFPATGFLTSSASQIFYQISSPTSLNPVANVTGIGLFLATDGNGDVTTGNGTLKVTVNYMDFTL